MYGWRTGSGIWIAISRRQWSNRNDGAVKSARADGHSAGGPPPALPGIQGPGRGRVNGRTPLPPPKGAIHGPLNPTGTDPSGPGGHLAPQFEKIEHRSSGNLAGGPRSLFALYSVQIDNESPTPPPPKRNLRPSTAD